MQELIPAQSVTVKPSTHFTPMISVNQQMNSPVVSPISSNVTSKIAVQLPTNSSNTTPTVANATQLNTQNAVPQIAQPSQITVPQLPPAQASPPMQQSPVNVNMNSTSPAIGPIPRVATVQERTSVPPVATLKQTQNASTDSSINPSKSAHAKSDQTVNGPVVHLPEK
jgi:hypothetical protein